MSTTTEPAVADASVENADVSRARLPATLDVMGSVWSVDRALQELSRVMALHLGITGPQRLVLRVVGSQPGISPKALAEVLYLDPSTLTGHIQRLEGDGFLTREYAREDARRQRLHLTDAGRKLDVKTPGTVEAAVEEILATHDEPSLAATRKVLADLARALRDQAEKCAAQKPSARPRARATRTRRR